MNCKFLSTKYFKYRKEQIDMQSDLDITTVCDESNKLILNYKYNKIGMDHLKKLCGRFCICC